MNPEASKNLIKAHNQGLHGYHYPLPITLIDDDGKRAWSWGSKTDSYNISFMVAWSWAGNRYGYLPKGRCLCGYTCPMLEDGYCVECHCVAYAALEAARKVDDWKEWLVTGIIPEH